MSRSNIQDEVEKDLRRSPKETVVYLEGKTDLEFLFALLGRPTPIGNVDDSVIYQDVLVKCCNGSTAVRARVAAGAVFRRSEIVIGVIDGDGASLDNLARLFDPPYSGPLFSWKAYCIENLLVKTGWPQVWGPEPVWQTVFRDYGPYVVLNQLHRNVIDSLKTLKIATMVNPPANEPLRSAVEVIEALDADKHLIQDFDVAEYFRNRLLEFQQAVDRDPAEVHAVLNGKWLIEHLAKAKTGFSVDRCRLDWIAHAIAVGGLAEIRDWWERITGSPP